MKIIFFKLILLPVALFAACCNHPQAARDQFTGTYVNHAQSAYSVADDTLLIKADPLTENSYQVTRKTGFRRTNGPWQRQTRVFSGIWDDGKQTLQLTQNGIIIQYGAHQLKV